MAFIATMAIMAKKTEQTVIPTEKKFIPTENTVLVFGTYGGLGNQLYYLCEHLMFARQGNMTLVPPTIGMRHLPGENETVYLQDENYDTFLDSRSLRKVVNVSHVLPKHCNNRVQHIFLGRRHGVLADQTPRYREAAQQLIGKRSNETLHSCAKRFTEGSKLHRRFLPMNYGANFSFVKEVASLRGSCVFLDGHSFFRKGAEPQEYLYSFMHYIEAAPRVKRIADQWKTDKLCVFHLRYDEQECLPDVDRMKEKVCIRRRLTTKARDTVIWTDVEPLVDGIVTLMQQKGANVLYIALSPYVPQRTASKLKSLFAKKVKIATAVPDGLGHMLKNFVERELAIRARVFVGDFASTWSGTLYYKRRTLSRNTQWSCALLEKCTDFAYYRNESKLETPDWFEKHYDVRPFVHT